MIEDKILKLEAGGEISYRHFEGAHAAAGKSAPAVFYLHGSSSSKDSTKALFVQEMCQKKGIGFTSFDLRGHGKSSGEFMDFTISDWLDDAVAVFDKVALGEQILVGSSLGGWLMILLALERKARVRGLVGISAAPDFTHMILEKLPPAMKEELYREGVFYTPSEYSLKGEPWTLKLLEDGEKHLVLAGKGKGEGDGAGAGALPLDMPCILLQGEKDDCVPVVSAFALKDRLASEQVRVCLFKDGKHNLSSPWQLAALAAAIKELEELAQG